jgi:signal transduction histidine kinase
LDERRIRYSQNIVVASDHLQTIIDDILDLARIETGELNMNCDALDCLDVMADVRRTFEMSAKERGITLSVDTSTNLPLVRADRTRMIQVLLNLGSNAVKYNVDGGSVLLAAYPKEDMVRFVLRDTGKGIPAARHAEIFEPFNRLGAEMGTEEGTGIGLAITRRLVHAMDGQIGFESVEGEGSKFWIDLPLAGEIATTKAVPASMPWVVAGIAGRKFSTSKTRSAISSRRATSSTI